MIQTDVRRIKDLTDALIRCRQQLAETENANAREIYGHVIMRYETAIADLSRPSATGNENAKHAKQ